MRADPIFLKRLGRAAAFALVGVAIVVTAARISHREPAAIPAPVAESADPLAAELERCRRIARPEDVDESCRAVWAEVRRRFFAPAPSNEVRP